MRTSCLTHLDALEDGDGLCCGFAMGQDQVQHPITIKVCHCTPCKDRIRSWLGSGPTSMSTIPC